MNFMKNIGLSTFIFSIAIFLSCNTMKKASQNINLFPVEKDVQLGKQVSAEIKSKPKEYPILDPTKNREVYKFINGITRSILRTGKVKHARDFKWEVKIIDDPKTLNAFCTPGGYIYVYTGLIKYLDSEDQLAGVMGHEMAHAALRHSTRQMTTMYGLQTLVQLATGKADPNKATQIAEALIGLKFSRKHEAEADAASVEYLCATSYNAAGAAVFFEKIQKSGQGSPPEFISTHPSPKNRVKDIHARAKELHCRGKKKNQSRYAQIKRLLK